MTRVSRRYDKRIQSHLGRKLSLTQCPQVGHGMDQRQAVVWIPPGQRVESEVQLLQSWQLTEDFCLLRGGYAVVVEIQPF